MLEVLLFLRAILLLPVRHKTSIVSVLRLASSQSLSTLGNHALVFGATGIQGWAVVNQILNGYPSEDAFDKVTALTNRPITEKMLWPESKKLQVVSGINLLTDKGQNGLVKEMEEKIPDVKSVTHMFFFGTRETSSGWARTYAYISRSVHLQRESRRRDLDQHPTTRTCSPSNPGTSKEPQIRPPTHWHESIRSPNVERLPFRRQAAPI